MVRGTQKQIIHVKNPESAWCEEAFLVVRGGAWVPDTSATMAEEVERMLSGVRAPGEKEEEPPILKAKRWGAILCCFLGGVCLGVALTLLIL